MRSLHKLGSVVVALGTAVVLSGCASSSKEIAAAYVSPLAYDAYSCPQLTAEMQRISTRVHQVAGSVDDRAENDTVAMGVGVILFWPALFMLKGDGAEAQELARLKGEYDAVNQTLIRKNCGMSPAPTTAAVSTPAATAPSTPAAATPAAPAVPVAASAPPAATMPAGTVASKPVAD